jgi:hypothetical protein
MIKINIIDEPAPKKLTFGDLKCGQIFQYNPHSALYMKIKHDADVCSIRFVNNSVTKPKAVDITNDFRLVNFRDEMEVILYEGELNLRKVQ